jgi:K+-sensing histidine kinase KdpD
MEEIFMKIYNKHHKLLKRGAFVIFFSAIILVVTNLSQRFSSITSASTSAFCFLILVLLSAFLGDAIIAIIISVIATLCFDYFFLPPFGTFAISAFPDIISLVAFLLASIIISRLTASAAENAVQSKNLDKALTELKAFGAWLLSTPNEQLSLSQIAQEALGLFSLEYCSVRAYSDGKWRHFTGSAKLDIAHKIEKGALNLISDHPNNLEELIDEEMLGVHYTQVYRGPELHALFAIKSDSLPLNIVDTIAAMIGLRLLEVPNVAAATVK